MILPQVIVLSLGCIILFSILWSTVRLGISPTPTSTKVLKKVLALIPEDLEGEIHELGAGWGTMAWAVASHAPKACVIAWEMSPVPYLFCRLRLIFQPRSNITLHFKDLHRTDLRQARLVLAFLWTGAMTKLGPKFEAELPPGAAIISHTFAWHGKTPAKTMTANDLYRTSIYRYDIPAR